MCWGRNPHELGKHSTTEVYESRDFCIRKVPERVWPSSELAEGVGPPETGVTGDRGSARRCWE